MYKYALGHIMYLNKTNAALAIVRLHLLKNTKLKCNYGLQPILLNRNKKLQLKSMNK